MNKGYSGNSTNLININRKKKKRDLNILRVNREREGRREKEEEEEEEKRGKLEGKQKGVEENKFKGKIMYKYVLIKL